MKFPKLSERTVVGIIFISNLVFRLFRINSPSFAYYDESAFYLKAARSILTGGGDPNYMHPPLSKEIWALAIHFFGDNSFAWRGIQSIFASLAIVVVYLLAKKMFASRQVGLISAFLLSADFGWFTFSRVAVPEMFMASFFIFSLYFLYSFWESTKFSQLVLGALLFGLALASKWTVMIALPIFTFVLFKNYQDKLKTKVIVGLLFLSITSAVYFSSFFFVTKNFNLRSLETAQVQMLDYHFNTRNHELSKTNSDFLSQVRTVLLWPVYVYPLYAHQDGQNINAVVLLFNPVLLWGSLLASGVALKRLLKNRKLTKEVFLAVSFLSFWLLWLIAPRNSYPYYWLMGMPLAAILLAKFLLDAKKKFKVEVSVLLAASFVLLLFFYPLLTNIKVPLWYLRLLTGISGVN